MDRACTYLRHMLEATRQARAYVEGMDREDFMDDKRTQQAVIMNLMILGEAASKLLTDCAEVTQRHARVQWNSMKGMRNRIAHGYFEIDLAVVWNTVQSALPELDEDLASIVATECGDGSHA